MASILKGKFVWYELTTPDVAAAERFYGSVLGWKARDAQVPGMYYSLNSANGADIAGMMAPMMENTPSLWLGYVAVEDIDAAAAKSAGSGAQTIVPVSPIPGVGRFTLQTDPQGAPFAMIEYAEEFPKPSVPDHGIHGHGWWRELHTSDQPAAYGFYAEQFGWGKGDAMDMGPMGVYQLLTMGDGIPRGAMFNDRDRPPFWLFYFWVDDIDVAHDAVLSGGGKVVNGPMEVPGGAWVFEGRDPQGVTFALVGDRKKK